MESLALVVALIVLSVVGVSLLVGVGFGLMKISFSAALLFSMIIPTIFFMLTQNLSIGFASFCLFFIGFFIGIIWRS